MSKRKIITSDNLSSEQNDNSSSNMISNLKKRERKIPERLIFNFPSESTRKQPKKKKSFNKNTSIKNKNQDIFKNDKKKKSKTIDFKKPNNTHKKNISPLTSISISPTSSSSSISYLKDCDLDPKTMLLSRHSALTKIHLQDIFNHSIFSTLSEKQQDELSLLLPECDREKERWKDALDNNSAFIHSLYDYQSLLSHGDLDPDMKEIRDVILGKNRRKNCDPFKHLYYENHWGEQLLKITKKIKIKKPKIKNKSKKFSSLFSNTSMNIGPLVLQDITSSTITLRKVLKKPFTRPLFLKKRKKSLNNKSKFKKIKKDSSIKSNIPVSIEKYKTTHLPLTKIHKTISPLFHIQHFSFCVQPPKSYSRKDLRQKFRLLDKSQQEQLIQLLQEFLSKLTYEKSINHLVDVKHVLSSLTSNTSLFSSNNEIKPESEIKKQDETVQNEDKSNKDDNQPIIYLDSILPIPDYKAIKKQLNFILQIISPKLPKKAPILSTNFESIDQYDLSTDYDVDIDEWIECILCHQWRRLPNGIKGSYLPHDWNCTMNEDFNYNQCEIPQENYIMGTCWYILDNPSNLSTEEISTISNKDEFTPSSVPFDQIKGPFSSRELAIRFDKGQLDLLLHISPGLDQPFLPLLSYFLNGQTAFLSDLPHISFDRMNDDVIDQDKDSLPLLEINQFDSSLFSLPLSKENEQISPPLSKESESLPQYSI